MKHPRRELTSGRRTLHGSARSGNQSRTRSRAGSSRSKRDEIITVATDYFGRQGYEDTKWADVASAVGVGSTALYHYFESKQHCLYVIMAEAIESFREHLDQWSPSTTTSRRRCVAVLRARFVLTEQEIHRNRVLVAEQGLVGVCARRRARRRPASSPARARATSRWRGRRSWRGHAAAHPARERPAAHDPGGARPLQQHLALVSAARHAVARDVRDFYVPRQLAVLGVDEDAAGRNAAA